MSDFSIAELLLLQLFLIFLNAVFACAEIAVISINGNKLKKMSEDGNKQAARLLELTTQPAKFLATIQVGITLAGFLGSAFAAENFSDKVVDFLVAAGVSISPQKLDVLAVIGITLILSYITLILGELVPKRIAMQYAEKIGLGMSGPIYVIAKIFAPIVWLLTFSTNAVLRLIKINPESEDEKITKEEIRIMVDIGSENGTIDDIEQKMIHNVFEFDDKFVEEIMTHRTKAVLLDMDAKPEQWENIMLKTRYSRYPVYQGNPDNIVGVISIKDYFRFKDGGKKSLLQKALKPAQFILESLHIDDLFRSMRKSRNHFAVVVDEYGSFEGIVTINDVLEEIVGELEPPSTPLIEKTDAGAWRIKGDAALDDVCAALKTELPDEGYDTFAGFVLSLMDNVPQDKQDIELTYNNLKSKVLQVKRRKIEDTLVQFIEKR